LVGKLLLRDASYSMTLVISIFAEKVVNSYTVLQREPRNEGQSVDPPKEKRKLHLLDAGKSYMQLVHLKKMFV
jgi:hypothetical protein